MSELKHCLNYLQKRPEVIKLPLSRWEMLDQHPLWPGNPVCSSSTGAGVCRASRLSSRPGHPASPPGGWDSLVLCSMTSEQATMPSVCLGLFGDRRKVVA